ncbi:MAG: GNAT family N-acetyltransferase [Holophagales bacterium]|nr:GNAT family N-acetyltransferase [Holophagales bacterium]
MTTYALRPATLVDAPVLAELSRQLGYPSSPEQTEQRLLAILGSDDQKVLVACSADGTLVGWIHVFLAHRVESGPFAEIGGFVVSEGHRGQGVGTELLAGAEDWVAERGVSRLRVRTRADRDGAQAFYSRRGFSTTKSQRVLDKRVEPGRAIEYPGARRSE